MMKILLVLCLIIAVISLLLNVLLWLKVNAQSQKRRELKRLVLKNQNDNLISLENHRNHIERMILQIKQLQKGVEQEPVQQEQKVSLTPQAVQLTPTEKEGNGVGSNQDRSKPENKIDKKKLDKGNSKPQQPVVTKTIYLGINSDDIFFDVEEQKSATSKFVANLTSEADGTYWPIDVERVRASNVAASMKQSGTLSIKDAHSFKVITPGKIHKEDDGWRIVSPVIVEFIK